MNEEGATRSEALTRSPDPDAPPRANEPTLADLLTHIGPNLLEVVAAPRGLEIGIGSPVVYDALFPPPLETGDVVLAVGVAAGTSGCVELLEEAGRRGATAMLIKLAGPAPQALHEAGEAAGVAVIRVTPELGWGQCLALVRTALAGAGAINPSGLGPRIGDLFGLANAVAAMVGGAVTIEDPGSRVLAYSSVDEPLDEPRRQTILGRHVPEPWLKRLQEAGVFRRLWASEDVVRFEYPGEDLRPRLAIAVRAGGEILGSIWVMEGREPFGPQAEEALREAARLAALHLIRHRTGEDVERLMRAELLRSVLEGRWPPEMAAERLGLDADTPCAVVAFEPEAGDEGAGALRRERALDLITVYCESFRRRAACATVGSAVYALLPVDPQRRERLRAFAHDVVGQAEAATGVRLWAGIGSTVVSLHRAPESRREADQALRVARAPGADGRVADIDEVRGAALLDELRDLARERPHLRTGKLELLVEHDRKHGTAYVESLRAYLHAFGDVPTAAEAVKVHPNTFRYRIRRLEQLSGLTLSDPTERLAAEIQLQFLTPSSPTDPRGGEGGEKE